MRYLLTGIFLTGFLIGTVFLLRLGRGKIETPAENFPRTKGPSGAPIQIMEYSDFQCPSCKEAQPVLSGLLDQYPGKIRLIFQHFPLEAHAWSPLAHRAAECAAEQNRFWPYHDRLYAAQSEWSKSPAAPLEAFLRYAKEEGLALDDFARCLGEGKVDQKIREEKSAGLGVGVRSTPSFFVNGKLAVGTQALRTEIEKITHEDRRK